MLNFICGQVVHIGEGTLVVQNGGIGYEFLVSSNTLQKCPVGETVQLHAKLEIGRAHV